MTSWRLPLYFHNTPARSYFIIFIRNSAWLLSTVIDVPALNDIVVKILLSGLVEIWIGYLRFLFCYLNTLTLNDVLEILAYLRRELFLDDLIEHRRVLIEHLPQALREEKELVTELIVELRSILLCVFHNRLMVYSRDCGF